MLISTALLFVGCEKEKSGEITSFDDLKKPGVKIGVAYDLPEYDMLKSDYPDAEIVTYNSDELGYGDVASGRLDAYIYIRLEMEFAIDNGRTGVRLLNEDYSERTVAVGISPVSKIPDLQKKINTFIKMIRVDGTLDDMYDRWALKGEDTMPDIPKAENPQYHLRVGTTGTVMPFSYFIGPELSGFDIELAYRFAAWIGADVEFKIYDFAGTVAAAAAGDVDCVMSNLFKTEERGESMPFSDDLFSMNLTAMVRDGSDGGITKVSDLKNSTIAVMTGTNFAEHVSKSLPDAKILYFNVTADEINALKSGKVDAVAIDQPAARNVMVQDKSVTLVPELLEELDYGFVFQKNANGEELSRKMNGLLSVIKSDGTLTSLQKKWFDAEDLSIVEMPDYTKLPATNGTIKLATAQNPPFAFTANGILYGYEIEIAYMFCREYGYALEVTAVNMDAIIPAIQSCKYDIACCGISITEERKESMYFSDPDYSGGTALLIRKSDSRAAGAFKSIRDLKNGTIAVITGSNFPDHVLNSLPNANLKYFNTTADCINALKSGKVDAVAEDEPVALNIMAQDNSFYLLPEMLEAVSYGFVFQKSAAGEELRDKFNSVLSTLKADGTLTSLQNKWFRSADVSTVEMPDYRKLPATNGTLRLVTIQSPPFSFTIDGIAGGYEIEIAYIVCRECGLSLEVTDVNMDALISSVQSGKHDVACCAISITEERKETMLFSDPDYSGGTVLIAKKVDAGDGDLGFFASIADSFNKTFIRENRWKLFLQGIGTTMLITALSIVLGTALGFFVFMLCRRGNRAANAITRFCIWLIHGMPVVVLLMILYYIVFGEVAISGTIVSIVGFTLIFASAVVSMMKTGVGAIDKGQTEAAYALGFTDRRAFYRVVLPQALPHFMPTYKSEITSLIKATAVVGYVAVQDLTKMGDVIRSRTYEAFFPLIAVAIIYFVLAAVLTFIVNKIEIRVDPRRRSHKDILKVVNGK